MIGLPTETYEDLDEIVQLVYELAKIRLEFKKKPGAVNLSIGTFIAKPNTYFERYKLNSSQEIVDKQNYLRQKFKKRYIKYNFTSIKVSLLEAALSRGNRQIGKVVHEAWRSGARLDAWHEHYRPDVWERAFVKEGINWEKYATRERAADEILPWKHIDI